MPNDINMWMKKDHKWGEQAYILPDIGPKHATNIQTHTHIAKPSQMANKYRQNRLVYQRNCKCQNEDDERSGNAIEEK